MDDRLGAGCVHCRCRVSNPSFMWRVQLQPELETRSRRCVSSTGWRALNWGAKAGPSGPWTEQENFHNNFSWFLTWKSFFWANYSPFGVQQGSLQGWKGPPVILHEPPPRVLPVLPSRPWRMQEPWCQRAQSRRRCFGAAVSGGLPFGGL